MYKILGADGKEYGPVSTDQLRDWVAQVPELGALFGISAPPPLPSGAPPLMKPQRPAAKQQGLAILSFVLGICSFVLCLSALSGIPAIICGHISRSRAKRLPQQYGG